MKIENYERAKALSYRYQIFSRVISSSDKDDPRNKMVWEDCINLLTFKERSLFLPIITGLMEADKEEIESL